MTSAKKIQVTIPSSKSCSVHTHLLVNLLTLVRSGVG